MADRERGAETRCVVCDVEVRAPYYGEEDDRPRCRLHGDAYARLNGLDKIPDRSEGASQPAAPRSVEREPLPDFDVLCASCGKRFGAHDAATWMCPPPSITGQFRRVPASVSAPAPSEKARKLVTNHESVAMAYRKLGATELGEAERAVLDYIAELESRVAPAPAPVSEREPSEETPNQCDGCRRGLPLDEHGNHFDPHSANGYSGWIGCTKDRYAASPARERGRETEPTTFDASDGVEAFFNALSEWMAGVAYRIAHEPLSRGVTEWEMAAFQRAKAALRRTLTPGAER